MKIEWSGRFTRAKKKRVILLLEDAGWKTEAAYLREHWKMWYT